MFSWFDPAGKGYFTLAELQNTVGNIIQPPETLYFRQDNSVNERQRFCVTKNCQRKPLGYAELCIVCMKQEKQQALNLLLRIYKTIQEKEESASHSRSTLGGGSTGYESRWSRFIKQLV